VPDGAFGAEALAPARPKASTAALHKFPLPVIPPPLSGEATVPTPGFGVPVSQF